MSSQLVITKLMPIALIIFMVDGSRTQSHGARQLRGRSSRRDAPPNLPPHLMQKFQKLPSQAQDRVFEIFEETNVDPDVDGPFLHIDESGGVYYEELLAEDEALPAEEPSSENSLNDIFFGRALQVPTPEVPVYHSRPGAKHTIFLDFDGHDFSGHAWASGALILAKPYSKDADFNSFSQEELNIIRESWEKVSEDYAPFDVDVTTEEPASLGPTVGHVLITDRYDRNGLDFGCSCGGIAYVNSYGATWTPSGATKPAYEYYSPALVFNKGSALFIAEAASHEFGHNLGLNHDGVNNGTAYYDGHGSGETDWASIMGTSYYSKISQWSKGEYPNANQKQDDLAIIAGKLGYLADDHPDPTPLTINGSTGTASGNIERNTDSDVFTFQGWGTNVEIIVDTENNPNYGNLDAGFRLVNSDTATTIAVVENPNQRDATWTGNLPDLANYEIIVYGTGNNENDLSLGYTNYGSLGHYSVSVTNIIIPSPTATPTAAPTPFPTMSPTAPPSPFPTKSPTPNPTEVPTPFPTKSPTAPPSPFPTKSPTTPNPTAAPTPFPTKSPTAPPSPFPTESPTTPNPTAAPTPFPTKSPTAPPSPFPTKIPTATPTAVPTPFPTKIPTAPPSPYPTKSPTAPPTPFPTNAPTRTPTGSPTLGAYCGDGICNANESCETCNQDCPHIQLPGAVCGNGICESANNEDCMSCPQDCFGETSGNPRNRFCCGDSSTGCDSTKCSNSLTSCTLSFVESINICPQPEICNDGIDNDGNGLVDCDDPACATDCPQEADSEICDDGIDNDGNGLTDCSDPACSGHLSCLGGGTCEVSGALNGSCRIDPSRCCSGECHKKFDRCK